jgi:ceramide glucosyltransferase
LLAVWAARGTSWSWLLFGATVAARLALGLTSALAVIGAGRAMRDIFLLPVRDLIAPVVWVVGLVGNRIFWRGDVFYLKDGRLIRVADETAGEQENLPVIPALKK